MVMRFVLENVKFVFIIRLNQGGEVGDFKYDIIVVIVNWISCWLLQYLIWFLFSL